MIVKANIHELLCLVILNKISKGYNSEEEEGKGIEIELFQLYLDISNSLIYAYMESKKREEALSLYEKSNSLI